MHACAERESGTDFAAVRINLWNRNNSFPHGSQNNPEKHKIVRDLQVFLLERPLPNLRIPGRCIFEGASICSSSSLPGYLFRQPFTDTLSRRDKSSKGIKATDEKRDHDWGRHLSVVGGIKINLDRHRFLRAEGHSGNAASANSFKWLRIGSHRRV